MSERSVVPPFFTGLFIQWLSYTNLTVNYRAIAHNQVLFAMVTDALAVIISVVIVRRIAGVSQPWTWSETGMVIGGSLAAASGMWMTRNWG